MRVEAVYINEYFRLTPGRDYAADQLPLTDDDGREIGHVVSAIARADGQTLDLVLEVEDADVARTIRGA